MLGSEPVLALHERFGVVAQMLEANPKLTPALVRRGLTETARSLPDVAATLQGAGVLQPRLAVEWALAHR